MNRLLSAPILALLLAFAVPAAGQSIRDQVGLMAVTYTDPLCTGFVVSDDENGWDYTGNSYAVLQYVMGEFPERLQLLIGTYPRFETATSLRVYLFLTPDGSIDGDISQGPDHVRHVYVRVLDHSLSAFDAGMRLYDTCQ